MKLLERGLPILLLAACGYRLGTLHERRSISVSMFENSTERRDEEFDLTRQVIRELSRQGVQVDPRADRELRGEIVSIQQPVVVDDRLDNPRVTSLVMSVRYRIVDRRTGGVLREGEAYESAVFSAARNQTLESARSEVLDRLAKTLVSKLETGW
jgi:outer membrane lipopolysaccharide assembly protein LptE/RlpB